MEPAQQSNESNDKIHWFFKLTLFILVIVICLIAALLLLFIGRGSPLNSIGSSNNLDPVDRLYLSAYLAVRSDDLERPIGPGSDTLTFIVEPGQHADQIIDNLVELSLLEEPELFRNYLRYYGFDSQIEAGIFEINPSLTIPQLANTLLQAQPQDIELSFLEGWRKEEMVEYLKVIQPANIDPNEFEAIADGGLELQLDDYEYLSSLPEGAPLEGFLFPDTYRVPVDAEASQLVYMMLDNFDRRVTPAMRQSFGVEGLTINDAVILASIVQREAVVPSEQPLMVGVFLNRLKEGMPLQADPTVQYALGYQQDTNTWWKSPISLADLQIDSPYNTYLYPGLPPGPISNPGLAALEAVSAPERSEYLYFVVDCTADIKGSHVFSTNFEEHLFHVERCR